MQKFENPELKISFFAIENIITSSGLGEDDLPISPGNQSVDKSSPYAE